MEKCKITVLKKTFNKEIFDEYCSLDLLEISLQI